ncbi:hypothetical protein RU820_05345 [Acidithiobacillus ferrooxidans]|uniref:hypothetical protein n=1 Tax=Acidithiobacillus ferrooxidans TaxID=920 RepID=UPI0005A14B53|nr:hypothetical protein [Acidithiobacillus ferrooxidans]
MSLENTAINDRLHAAGYKTASKSINTRERRSVDRNGIPMDRKPLLPNDRFVMVSGRVTTPYQKQKGLHYAIQWLIDNAIAEAISNNDGFNMLQFQQISAKKPTTADLDCLTMYLFDVQPYAGMVGAGRALGCLVRNIAEAEK